MKVYLIEIRSNRDIDIKFERLQVFLTKEKAQEKMREIHDALMKEFPNAKHSCVEDRAHLWYDTEGFNDGTLVYQIADVLIWEKFVNE